MTKIKTIDYHNDLTQSVSKKTRQYCYDTFIEIKKLSERIKTYKDTIRENEFKLGAITRDYTSLLESRNYKDSNETKILENKIEEVSTELCVDRNFIRDLNKLTEQKVGA